MFHKDIQTDDKVRIIKTNSVLLDGKEGLVLGKSHQGLIDTFIVMLNEPVQSDNGFVHKAIALTESCLEHVVEV